MAKWKLAPGARMVSRDDEGVRHDYRGGDEVELTEEQEQRLKPGTPGSPFLPQDHKDEEPEVVEVAVANEATLPADDGFQVSPRGTRNRKVAAAPLPSAEDAAPAPARDAESGGLPEPTSTTENKTARKR